MRQMVKLPMLSVRCSLAVELWPFWGDGRNHNDLPLFQSPEKPFFFSHLYISRILP